MATEFYPSLSSAERMRPRKKARKREREREIKPRTVQSLGITISRVFAGAEAGRLRKREREKKGPAVVIPLAR